MKKSSKLFITLAGIVFFACEHHNITVKIEDSESMYEITATYPEDMTGEVQDYINSSFRPNRIFSGKDDVIDAETPLRDGTIIHIKSSKGEFNLQFDKEENSRPAYEQMKRIGAGMGKVLK